MSLEIVSTLIIILIYTFHSFKKGYSKLIISLFLLIVFSKLFFIYLEYTNLFVNRLTIRDESTFIQYAIEFNFIRGLNFFFITSGDYFLFYILNSFYSIFNTQLSIKLVPVLFSIIAFHYSYKLTNFLKFNEINSFFIILFIFFWPSNFLFNYSATKEFLQTTFLIILVYYSLKLLVKFNLSIILKYLIFLFLFSYTHRGFEVIGVMHTIILLSLIIFMKIKSSFINSLNFIFISTFSICFIFAFLLHFGILDDFIKNIISYDFLDWYNNSRLSRVESPHTYYISIDNLSFNGLFKIALKTLFYYFFYLPNIGNYFYIYYFFEIILVSFFIFIIIKIFIQKEYVKYNSPKFSFSKIFLLISLYFMINFGFAFFNTNIGNAVRHKTVSSFIIFLFIPFFYFFMKDLVSKFSIKKLYYYYYQRR